MSIFRHLIIGGLGILCSCENRNSSPLELKVLKDSIQNLNSAYYASEDVLSHAYLNSDTHQIFPEGKTLLNYKFNILMDNTILFNYDWIVFIPRSPCISCIKELCGTLKSHAVIKESAFIMPMMESSDYLSLLQRNGVPIENIFFFEGNLGIPIEQEERLFIFTLSKDYTISNIFVPEKKLQNLTEIYLNVTKIKRKGIYNIIPLN